MGDDAAGELIARMVEVRRRDSLVRSNSYHWGDVTRGAFATVALAATGGLGQVGDLATDIGSGGRFSNLGRLFGQCVSTICAGPGSSSSGTDGSSHRQHRILHAGEQRPP